MTVIIENLVSARAASIVQRVAAITRWGGNEMVRKGLLHKEQHLTLF